MFFRSEIQLMRYFWIYNRLILRKMYPKQKSFVKKPPVFPLALYTVTLWSVPLLSICWILTIYIQGSAYDDTKICIHTTFSLIWAVWCITVNCRYSIWDYYLILYGTEINNWKLRNWKQKNWLKIKYIRIHLCVHNFL